MCTSRLGHVTWSHRHLNILVEEDSFTKKSRTTVVWGASSSQTNWCDHGLFGLGSGSSLLDYVCCPPAWE